jgi:hypothetical protein
MVEPMDDRELERLMKEGLERRAASVDESAGGQLVAAARAGSSRGPWRTTAVMGLAAASVAGIAFATVALDDDDIRSGGRGPDTTGDPATGTPVTEWRTEHWHDIQVDVPADWGWGGAPLPDSVSREDGGEGRLLDCGAAAFVGANGARFLNGDSSVPYVGRPMYMTDVCSVVGSSDGKPDTPPSAPYVWLGVRIEPGLVDVGDGYTQETIEVNGSTVTVATTDPELRQEILATAGGGETCLSEYDGAPTIQLVPREGVPEVTGMTVCAYAEADGQARLTYVTHVGQEAARAFSQAAGRTPVVDCPQERAHEWVLLTVEGAGGLRQEHLVQLGECSGIQMLPGEELVELNVETVAPWAVDGIPAYVVGPYGGKGLTGGFFKGMLG